MRNLLHAIPRVIRAELSTLRTMCVGKVVSYDSARQTCTAQVLIKDRVRDGETGEVQYITVPPIPDVPVQWPSAGGMSLTMPLAPGDPVTLFFSDRSLNEWVASSQNNPVEPFDPRQFDLSDAIAVPGAPSPSRALPGAAVSDDAAVLRTVELRVGDSGASTPVALSPAVDTNEDNIRARLSALEAWATTVGSAVGTPFTPVPAVTTPTDSNVVFTND